MMIIIQVSAKFLDHPDQLYSYNISIRQFTLVALFLLYSDVFRNAIYIHPSKINFWHQSDCLAWNRDRSALPEIDILSYELENKYQSNEGPLLNCEHLFTWVRLSYTQYFDHLMSQLQTWLSQFQAGWSQSPAGWQNFCLNSWNQMCVLALIYV